MIGVANISIS